MKRIAPLLASLGLGLGIVGLAAPSAGADPAASGTPGAGPGAHNVVFVQTDNPAGNQVDAYHRTGNGALALVGTYDTGGLGGVLNGSVVDHLASQGSLAYDAGHALLYAVNAGSNTVSVFSVHGDRLTLRQVLSSGGTFPVSVAVHDGLVYVLNAENGAGIQGFVSSSGQLVPLASSNRTLGLTIPTDQTQFVNTPGQVAFSSDGTQLIVTTKANGNDIDVFGLDSTGLPSSTPVVNAESGTVPFAVVADAAGHLVVADAGTNALTTYALASDGTLTSLDSVGTGATATCWVATAGSFLYAGNAASASESGFTSSSTGTLTLLGSTATDPGTVDASASPGGRYLYVQTGANGVVDEFSVGAGGTLTSVGSVTVAGGQGGEGIVAL
jgi:6-phosphogluconolactonase (cycloisomerase 2 family)